MMWIVADVRSPMRLGAGLGLGITVVLMLTVAARWAGAAARAGTIAREADGSILVVGLILDRLQAVFRAHTIADNGSRASPSESPANAVNNHVISL